MKQTLTQPEELDQVLMTMAGHDLKKLVGAVSAALTIYLREVNNKYIDAADVQYIAERITDMHHAGKEMLLCINEILAVLNRSNPPAEPLRGINLDELISLKQIPPAGGRYSGPDSPPSLWHV